MVYVQHLLGVGHLQRMRWLADALARHGFGVTLVSGGMPPADWHEPAFTLHQLPPARCADASFSHLLDTDGRIVDERWRKRRRRQLLDCFDALEPRVLITETFPFGRRLMSFELIPLLERARQRRRPPLVLSSVRDILQPKSKPGRNREICQLVETFYDRILVHGDPALATLADSFAETDRIADRLFYSGYICAPVISTETAPPAAGDVLVSAGGSATGLRLLETALAARPLCALREQSWRILVSPAVDAAAYERLLQQAGGGVTVERNRPDFAALMRGARLSISQAGYNTITDILRSRAAAVLVPFDEAGEVEQKLRAERLAERGRAVLLEARDLAAASLAAAIDEALAHDTSLEIDLDGADKSAAQIGAWLSRAPA